MFSEFNPSRDPLPLLDPSAFGVLIIVYLGQHAAGSRGHKYFQKPNNRRDS